MYKFEILHRPGLDTNILREVIGGHFSLLYMLVTVILN